MRSLRPRPRRSLLLAPAAAARPRRHDHLLRRHADRALVPSRAERRQGADDPRGPRLGRLAPDRPERAPATRRPATSASAPLRKAGFNVLTWDSRGFGNSGGTVTVDAPDKEARDVSALIDWLAHAARGAARQGRRPARGHDRRLLRGRDRAHDRGAGQAHRRDRPDHRLALAADLALQGGDGQGRLVVGALRRRRRRLQGPPGPAHHVRVRLRRHDRHAERRGPRLVRLAAARATSSSRSRSRRSSSRAPRTRCSRSTRRSTTTRSSRATASRPR